MIRFTILGEPASKANSREIGVLKFRDKTTGESRSRPTVRKSDKALAYEGAAKELPTVWMAVRTGLRRVLEHVSIADLAAHELPAFVDEMADEYRVATEHRRGEPTL